MDFNHDKLLTLVSRSFALCIPRLPKKVRKEVGNFYLLCRYADSIEDSDLSKSHKKKAFGKFAKVVKSIDLHLLNELNKEILEFVISENDKKMIKEFGKVIGEYSSFDKKSRKIALKWLKEMMKGMQKYSKKEIQDFLDLDNYCYYVAGTVGHYLTNIFDHKFDLNVSEEFEEKGKQFGLLLQKVNVIRDFSKDYVEGRIFWPKKLFEKYGVTSTEIFKPENEEIRKKILKEMIDNALTNLKSAIEYIEKLPVELTGVRMFCAIPLGMAVPTLMKCSDNSEVFDPQKKVKISRTETAKILNGLNKSINSNEFLTKKPFVASI
ncbi:MAG: squalene/phytoene synthase family protein [Candidatus Diapherotrites archaeon]